MLFVCESPAVVPAYAFSASVRFQVAAFSDAVAQRLEIDVPAHLARAHPKRRAEYTAGRYCARRALQVLLPGFAGQIATAADRAPCWPDGVVGTITHTHGFASAAVALARHARGIGMDSERVLDETTAGSIRKTIAAPGEAYPDAFGWREAIYRSLLFSAKESVFKCLYPVVRRMFYFEHVKVEFETARTFRATLLSDLSHALTAGCTLPGLYSVAEPYVHTGVALRAIAAETHASGQLLDGS